MSFFRIIFILLCLWLVGLAWFIKDVEKIDAKTPQDADAIVVLTGSSGRIDAGLELLEANKAKHLFISGVGQDATLEDLSRNLTSFEQEKVANLKDHISLGHAANSTDENATEATNWVKEHGYNSIILVTSNYHMPRSLYIFKKSMTDVTIIPYPLVKNEQFWQLNTLKIVALEYNKLLLSRFMSHFSK